MDFDNVLFQKLNSMGQYTEALSDYIKMLLSHKKSREELIGDLELFLRDETNIFVDWLLHVTNNDNNIENNHNINSDNVTNNIEIETKNNLASNAFNKLLDNRPLMPDRGNFNTTNNNMDISEDCKEIVMSDPTDNVDHGIVNNNLTDNRSRFNRFLNDVKQAQEPSKIMLSKNVVVSGGKSSRTIDSHSAESRRRDRLINNYGSDLRSIINDLKDGKISTNKSVIDCHMDCDVDQDYQHINGHHKDVADMSTTNDLKTKIPDSAKINNGRCKFWPSCKNNECVYYHPIQPCMNFPNCRFGNKCLNIHPVCKFNTKCTNPQCPYTHFIRPNVNKSAIPNSKFTSSESLATTMSIDIDHCSQSNYEHPHGFVKQSFSTTLCKFGINCRNKHCPYQHEGNKITEKYDMKRMKYIAPDLLHNQNV